MEKEWAPNPWTEDGSPLPSASSPLDREEILDRIRMFLKGWPGKPTSLVDAEERHRRIIHTIAGYPSIKPTSGQFTRGTTPLDNPLDWEGVQCFEMTLSLDSYESVLSTSSLWTDILEFEFEYADDESEVQTSPRMPPEERTVQVLAILFCGLLERKPLKRKAPRLSRAAQSLLAELFSYHTSGKYGLTMWHNVAKRMRNPTPPGWKTVLRAEDYFTVTYEVKRIKSWMKEILPKPERSSALSQAYLRGASSLVKLVSVNERNLQSFTNLSSVLIDGGGRMMVKWRRAWFPNRSFDPRAIESHFGVTIDDPSLSSKLSSGSKPHRAHASSSGTEGRNYVGTHGYFIGGVKFSDIGTLTEALIPLRLVHYNLNADPEKKIEWDTKDPKFQPEATTSSGAYRPDYYLGTPKVVESVEPPKPNSLDMILENIKVHGFPEGGLTGSEHGCRVISPWDSDCPRCNPSLDLSASEGGDIDKGRGGFCFGHSLLYKIGVAQRTKDSARRQPDAGIESVPFPPHQRKVVAIARIDGNSIGWLLNRERFNNPQQVDSDGIRRRSMRFNAHWWSALSKTIHQDSKEIPDRVACWVSAGDDIVLAEYSSNGHTSPPGQPLINTLERFAKNLDGGLNEELRKNPDGPLATFAASVSTDVESKITGMLDAAAAMESEAKAQWKADHSNTSRVMISEEKLSRENYGVPRIVLPTNGWSKDTLEDIARQSRLDISSEEDLARLQDICFRAEFVVSEGEKAILIPERIAGTEDCPEHTTLPLPTVEDGITNLILIEKPH